MPADKTGTAKNGDDFLAGIGVRIHAPEIKGRERRSPDRATTFKPLPRRKGLGRGGAGGWQGIAGKAQSHNTHPPSSSREGRFRSPVDIYRNIVIQFTNAPLDGRRATKTGRTGAAHKTLDPVDRSAQRRRQGAQPLERGETRAQQRQFLRLPPGACPRPARPAPFPRTCLARSTPVPAGPGSGGKSRAEKTKNRQTN